MVGIRGELSLQAVILASGESHLRTLGALLAGGRLALRHFDVLLEMQRGGGWRECDADRANADNHRDHDSRVASGELADRHATPLRRTVASTLSPPEFGIYQVVSYTFPAST